MSTKKVYFDIPSKRSTALLEVSIGTDLDELTRGVSHMMGAAAIRIDRKEYLAKTEMYKEAACNG